MYSKSYRIIFLYKIANVVVINLVASDNVQVFNN